MVGKIGAARAVLLQGESLLISVGENLYTRPSPLADGSTIGGHYRHVLEHYLLLLKGAMVGAVDYDARQRDREVESVLEAALAETRRLSSELHQLEGMNDGAFLEIQCGITYGGEDSGQSSSTLGREVMFCISHAVHHYAIIALILRANGCLVPEGFGVAPSTIRYRQSLAVTN
jgi:uncharacterized damage-inducible protein DinB